MDEADPDNFHSNFLYGEYENILVQVLDEAFGIEEMDYPDIDFFIYDLEFGAKCDVNGVYLVVDGKPIDISTPEKLYDYLVSEEEYEDN